MAASPSPEVAAALRESNGARVENEVTARLAEDFRDRVMRLVPDPERMAIQLAGALREAIGYRGPERRTYHGPERRHLAVVVPFPIDRRRRA